MGVHQGDANLSVWGTPMNKFNVSGIQDHARSNALKYTTTDTQMLVIYRHEIEFTQRLAAHPDWCIATVRGKKRLVGSFRQTLTSMVLFLAAMNVCVLRLTQVSGFSRHRATATLHPVRISAACIPSITVYPRLTIPMCSVILD